MIPFIGSSILQKEMKKQDNVAIASSVLNIIDEVECGLIKKEDALMLSSMMIENCDSYSIKKLLEYWIDYFL